MYQNLYATNEPCCLCCDLLGSFPPCPWYRSTFWLSLRPSVPSQVMLQRGKSVYLPLDLPPRSIQDFNTRYFTSCIDLSGIRCVGFFFFFLGCFFSGPVFSLASFINQESMLQPSLHSCLRPHPLLCQAMFPMWTLDLACHSSLGAIIRATDGACYQHLALWDYSQGVRAQLATTRE